MKQNQSLFRSTPVEKQSIKPHDFLSIKAHCHCTECERTSESFNPQIKLDDELTFLRKNNQKVSKTCDFVFFLHNLKKADKNLPKFRFLDTIVIEEGQPAYAIYFEGGKLKVATQVSIKDWILEHKQSLDIKYQIKKHERQNDFHFTSFEHKCQKKIKEFQSNIKYKIPAVLNKIAIIKLRNQMKEVILAKNQFLDMFDMTKNKVYNMKDIQYIQVFPIMYGEEEKSYVKTIKYFRQKDSLKRSFKLAQAYVSTWKQKNDSIQKLEEKVYQEIKQQEKLQKITQQDKLCYQTYKLLIYFQQVSSIRVQEAVLHYITNDNGKSYFFKKIQCLKTDKKVSVDQLGTELPTKKDIPPQDYINLKSQMRGLFDGFQSQFDRLNKERQEMENKVKKDKQYSNFVFKTISSRRSDNFHEVLQSRNLKYKKEQLQL